MTPIEILHNALMDGVSISPDGIGGITLIGDEEAVSMWLPMIRDNKVTILAALSDRQGKREDSQGRTWIAGNPYTCSCGEMTGWRLDDQALCPVCFYDQYYGPDPETTGLENPLSRFYLKPLTTQA